MLKQGSTALQHVPEGVVKVTRISRIRTVPRLGGKIQKPPNFVIFAQNSVHSPDIGRIHAQKIVKACQISFLKLYSPVITAGDPLLPKLRAGAGMNRISDFLCADSRGGDVKILCQPLLSHQIFHDIFRHGRTAEVAVANK